MESVTPLSIKLFASCVRLENLYLGVAERFIHFQSWSLARFASLVANRKISKLQNDQRFLISKAKDAGTQTCDCKFGERGDVPGWVLVVLMTAGLVTGIWTIAAPRLNQILRTSLDSMNSIR